MARQEETSIINVRFNNIIGHRYPKLRATFPTAVQLH